MSLTQLIAELRLPALPDRLGLVRACVREAARLVGCDELTAENIVVAVNEACMNVIQHGYSFATDKEMWLSISQEEDRLVFDLLDQAAPTRIEQLKSRQLDEVRPGGLGVHFIRSIMDEMVFGEPQLGFINRLRMVKIIKQGATDGARSQE